MEDHKDVRRCRFASAPRVGLGGLVVLALSLSCTAQARSQAKVAPRGAPQPDVFLITIDTLRADHVHCYGYDPIKTPALDSLASDGIRFSQAFTSAPITNTAHAGILTGLAPSAHGVTDFGIPLEATHKTWAELLKDHGYRTAAFIGAVILDSKAMAPGFDRGFDFYDNFPATPSAKSRRERVERRAGDVVQRAEAWLIAHRSGPRFVWLHLYDPHDPYEPPAPFSQSYQDRLYDGEIAYADSALEELLTFLKTNGWYQNAIVIATGDHGEGLGEHNEDTHGIFLYDSTMRVPLIMKLPGASQRGSVDNDQVSTTGLLPTILDVLKLPIPEPLHGKSLLGYLNGAARPTRTVFGETDYPLRFGWAPLRSVRADRFKFIEAPRPELYDVSGDAGELHNLYEPWNVEVKKLREILVESRVKVGAATPSRGTVDPNTVEELQALGYLGAADVGSATNVPEPSLLPDPKDKIAEQNFLHSAFLAAEENHPAGARQALQKVLQLNPESFPALQQMGELQLAAGEYKDAAQNLRQAHHKQPGDATVLYLEGEAWDKAGETSSAREALESSLKLNPRQFPARLLLGQIYLRLKQANAAADQFEAALLLQPESAEAQAGLSAAKRDIKP